MLKRELTIQEIRNIQIDILSAVAAFCDENQITYFLSSGTLLGAVRHQGYIPWDDDIDIAMPRPDYRRFVELFQKQDSVYQVQALELDNHYPHAYAKVHDARTLLKEIENSKHDIGINIDVFPLDGLPADAQERTAFIKQIMMWRRIREVKVKSLRRKRDWYKTVILFFTKLGAWFIPSQPLVRHISRLIQTYPFEECNYVSNLNFGGTDRFFPKEIFQESTELTFENHTFKAPAGYDAWLSGIYGNYMELPPRKKQISNHAIKAYRRD